MTWKIEKKSCKLFSGNTVFHEEKKSTLTNKLCGLFSVFRIRIDSRQTIAFQ